jgi:mannosyl-oligosaccharide alpha-1,2-mannosidase
MLLNLRWRFLVLFAAFIVLLFLLKSPHNVTSSRPLGSNFKPGSHTIFQRPDCSSSALHNGKKFHWSCLSTRYQVASMKSLPSTSGVKKIPQIQAKIPNETSSDREIRLARLDAVKGNFTHAWEGYKSHAWLRDEVMPLSGRPHDPFGGWAATLVDSLGWYTNSLLYVTIQSLTWCRHSVDTGS